MFFLLLPLIAGSLLERYAELGRVPLRHSHNDYLQRRPLWDALDAGFESLEVDVHLLQGELYVGHNAPDVRAHWTLQTAYLDPLYQLFRAQPTHWPLILDVDFKDLDPRPAVARLDALLRNHTYAGLFSRMHDGERGWEWAPVTVYISMAPYGFGVGLDMVMATQPPRVMGTEGTGLAYGDPATLVLYEFSPESLAVFGVRAREEGVLARYVSSTNSAESWVTLIACGATVLATDDLRGLTAFIDHHDLRSYALATPEEEPGLE